MNVARSVVVLVALTMVAAACGATTGSSTPPPDAEAPEVTLGSTTAPDPEVGTEPFVSGELIQVGLPRSEPEVTDAEIAAVTRGDRALGLDLMRVAAGDANLMVSPYSVAAALSMLYPGARGRTAEEIADVLHLEVDDETLHEVRNAIDTALAETPPPQDEEDTREPFTIRPANSAWGQGGYPFLDEYLSVLAVHYGAGLRLLDFVADPGGATETINDWVEDTTEDRIRDLIPPDAIDDLTRLVLVNAIWFKANWAEKFDVEATSPGPFTLLDGGQVEASMMRGSFQTRYAETELYRAVRLVFAGDAAMVVVLPEAGTPGDLVAALEPDDLSIAWEDAMVDLTLPRFEFEADIPLKEALQTLGMETAFVEPRTGADHEADLTGITAARELFVSEALHKTFVAVDENGAEAAAATALIVGLASAPEPVRLVVDRPFLFWIEHTPTGELLFLGQVTDPTQG